MLDPNSRYYGLETATYIAPDGQHHAYKRRRFLPQAEALPVVMEVQVKDGDRLDLMAANLLGDPEAYWQICDANNAMNPFDLTTEIGRRLNVAQPQP